MSSVAGVDTARASYTAYAASVESSRSALADDALSELLSALEKLAQSSLSLSGQRIQSKRSELHDKLGEFLRALAEASRPKAHESSGLFGDIFGAMGDALGEVVGTLADFLVDAVKMPVTVGEGVIENWGDTGAMLRALGNSQAQLLQNGATAEDVRGFSEGVSRFGGELLQFTHQYALDLATGTMRGDSRPGAADLAHLWGSFKSNVLENPHFWAVVGAAAKISALAATALSGGALMPIALGLFIALEADAHFKILDRICPEAAPWIRLGVGLAAAGLCMFGGSAGPGLTWLRAASGLMSGATELAAGYNTIKNANLAADDLEQQAELQNRLNQIQRVQRTITGLLDDLASDCKDREATVKLGANLVSLKVQGDLAAIIRG